MSKVKDKLAKKEACFTCTSLWVHGTDETLDIWNNEYKVNV